MRLSTLTLVMALTFAVTAVAQDPTPPPPAAPKSRSVDTVTVVASKWESVDGAFKISFPGRPSTTSNPFLAAFGPSNIYITALGTALAHYTVSYFDFPTAITNKYDLDTRFTMMRDSQAKALNARITLDSEYMFGSHYGRAISYETAAQTISTRAILVGPRMYLIQIITPGKLSSMAPRPASATTTRVEKFLHSFEVTKVLEAKSTEVTLPGTFAVAATDTSFKSSFFGVSLTPPAGWKLARQENSELLMELGKDEIRRSNSRLADHLSEENARVLAMYANTDIETAAPEAFLFILAEKAPFPNFRAEAVAKTFITLYLDKNEKVTKPVTLTKVAGQEAAWLETFDSETKLNQRIYFLNVKGISFELAMTYAKPDQLSQLLRTVESIRFDGK